MRIASFTSCAEVLSVTFVDADSLPSPFLFRHGDLLYVGFAEAVPQVQSSKSQKVVVQDAVDDYLDTQNGLIKRDKDAKL